MGQPRRTRELHTETTEGSQQVNYREQKTEEKPPEHLRKGTASYTHRKKQNIKTVENTRGFHNTFLSHMNISEKVQTFIFIAIREKENIYHKQLKCRCQGCRSKADSFNNTKELT